MRLTDIDSIEKDLRAQLAAMGQCLDTLAKKIEDAKAVADPFAAHYYAARRSYRRAVATANKGGKNIERNLISTYRVAMELGFKGTIREWQALLRICLSS